MARKILLENEKNSRISGEINASSNALFLIDKKVNDFGRKLKACTVHKTGMNEINAVL